MSTPPVEQQQYLRQCGNPFQDTVRPQYTDWDAETHVPTIYRSEREFLLLAIDSYRADSYDSSDDLKPSRAIRIIGHRGAGKTQLLESIRHRGDNKSQLLITRKSHGFEKGSNFGEYLLQLLIQGLLEPHPIHGHRCFELLATQVSRRVLLQVLRALSPMEKLLALPRASGLQAFSLLWFGGGEQLIHRYRDLASDIERPSSGDELRRAIARAHFRPKDLGALSLAYIDQCEPGIDALSLIRREFLKATIRATLFEEAGALNDFLEASYQPANAPPISRGDIVHHLFMVAIEMCALVRLPIVFAFDNLEGLLAPNGIVDETLAKEFFEGVAQLISHHRGLLILLFAEEDVWRVARKAMSTFADDRLGIGVSLPGHPLRFQIDLPHLQSGDLRSLEAARIKRIFEGHPSLVGKCVFPPSFIEQQASRRVAVRKQLEAMRFEYDRLVFKLPAPHAAEPDAAPSQRPPAPTNGVAQHPEPIKAPSSPTLPPASSPQKSAEAEPPAKVNPPPKTNGELAADFDAACQRLWDANLLSANRQLQSSLIGSARQFVTGLVEAMKWARPLPGDTVPLRDVRLLDNFGDDPRYGIVALADYETHDATPAKVAIGFLLAQTTGMLGDLKSKLAVFKADPKDRPASLTILWAGSPAEGDAAALRGTVLDLWNKNPDREKTRIRSVARSELEKILALGPWIEALKQSFPTLDNVKIRAFIHAKFAVLFESVQPFLAKE